jgi:hypothetical protein
MTIKNYLDRPGIDDVHDADELKSIAGGAGLNITLPTNSTGAAELDAVLENKWIGLLGAMLSAFYWYGDPNHRLGVRSLCRRTASGASNAGRDSVNLIFKGVAKITTLATWVTSYFSGAAGSTSNTVAEICPDPPGVPPV